MNDLALAGRQVRYEQLAYWRNPVNAFFTFVFPLMFLVIFASLNRETTLEQFGGVAYNQYYIPAILTFGVVGATFTNLAMTLAFRRHLGILKRFRSTPVPAWAVLAGLIGSAILIAILIALLTIGVGALWFDLHVPARYAQIAAVLLAGTACFSALGIALQTLVPNADAAPAVVNGALFPVVFISGVFFPLPDDLLVSRIADLLPLKHFVEGAFAAFDAMATGWPLEHLAWLAGWAAFAAVVAVRRFKWDPGRPAQGRQGRRERRTAARAAA